MPQDQETVYRLPESLMGNQRPERLPIVDVMMGRESKRPEPIIDVLGKIPDRTKERR